MGRWRTIVLILVCVAVPVAVGGQDQKLQLDTGIALVRNGDFEAAVDVLRPLTLAMEGIARQMKQLATAYLYLGIAELEMDKTDDALRAFWEAQRRDASLTLSPTEFSPQILRTFEQARSFTPADAATNGSTAATATPVAPVAATQWLRREPSLIQMQVLARLEDGACQGMLDADRTAKKLRWTPAAGEPCEAWESGFADVRSISATTDGAFVVLLPNTPRNRTTFIPDIGSGNDADAKVAARNAVLTLEDTLGKQSGSLDAPGLTGATVMASLAELMESPGDYDGLAVRTTGKLDVISKDNGQYLLFANEFSVLIRPEAAVALRMKADADQLKEHEVEVVGAFRRLVAPARRQRGAPEFVITFWSYETTAQLQRDREASNATSMSLEALTTADPLPTTAVRVIGKFRGANIFGDLPVISRRTRSDWVIKDNLYALWVIDKAPEGDDWKLNPIRERDTIHWLEIVGKPEEVNGIIYLRADRIRLSAPPSGTAGVRTGPLAYTKDRLPDVQFTLPSEGVEEAAPDAIFAIQFTKRMDPGTFPDRVLLRYADGPSAGQPLRDLRVTYIDSRRVMQIDPGVALLPGRTLECVLLPGIKDSDGNDLTPATPPAAEGVRVFRWKVEGDAQ